MSETTADLSRRIAELVGDEGFFPAETCPQGHSNMDENRSRPMGPVGRPCFACIGRAASEAMDAEGIEPGHPESLRSYWDRHAASAEQLAKDPSLHPEWRIQRGEPKPYATSPELLIPLVEQWFADHPGFGLEITVAGESGQLGRYLRIRTPGGTVLGNSRFSDVTEMRARIARDASEFTQALAEVWLAVSERWGARA